MNEMRTTRETDHMPASSLGKDSARVAPKPYQLHGLRLLDADGRKVGYVDWFWTDDGSIGSGYVGVRLRWLRGTAIAVPALGMHADSTSSTVRVAYKREQIVRAGRFSVTRALGEAEKRSIHAHYRTIGRRVAQGVRAGDVPLRRRADMTLESEVVTWET